MYLSMSCYCMEHDKFEQNVVTDTVVQVTDTIGTRRILNEIYFCG